MKIKKVNIYLKKSLLPWAVIKKNISNISQFEHSLIATLKCNKTKIVISEMVIKRISLTKSDFNEISFKYV